MPTKVGWFEKKTAKQRNDIFAAKTSILFDKWCSFTMKKVDMVVLPVHAHNHFYVMTFNLKHKRFDIIDNKDTLGKSLIKYGKLPYNLVYTQNVYFISNFHFLLFFTLFVCHRKMQYHIGYISMIIQRQTQLAF